MKADVPWRRTPVRSARRTLEHNKIALRCRERYQAGEVPNREQLRDMYVVASRRKQCPWEGDTLIAGVVVKWHSDVFGWHRDAQEAHHLLLHCFKQQEQVCNYILRQLQHAGPAEYYLVMRSCASYASAHTLLQEYEQHRYAVTPDIIAALIHACSKPPPDVHTAERLFAECAPCPATGAAFMGVCNAAHQFSRSLATLEVLQGAGSLPSRNVLLCVMQAVSDPLSDLPLDVASNAFAEAKRVGIADTAMFNEYAVCLRARGEASREQTLIRDAREQGMKLSVRNAEATGELHQFERVRRDAFL
eukprot:TRINITY_DN1267_c2_g1_i1.p1 TRINITY_DN1267_c2_g1~~TRINITY_DN1267_c2_g1_i1.p1  ORF type:complete len:304 (+),score=76.25 TRINITY_DN1267_c2_g1_i1:430-1341(+)